jgi:hypothetical protein
MILRRVIQHVKKQHRSPGHVLSTRELADLIYPIEPSFRWFLTAKLVKTGPRSLGLLGP